MSGVEALRVLRADERTRAVPVVVMTASPGAIEAHGDELEALGAAVLVRKPFSAADLAATLARVLEPGRAA
jgi:CheY-like chemotaxis protein